MQFLQQGGNFPEVSSLLPAFCIHRKGPLLGAKTAASLYAGEERKVYRNELLQWEADVKEKRLRPGPYCRQKIAKQWPRRSAHFFFVFFPRSKKSGEGTLQSPDNYYFLSRLFPPFLRPSQAFPPAFFEKWE